MSAMVVPPCGYSDISPPRRRKMLFSHSILPLSKPAPDRARGHVVDELAFLLAQAVIVLAAIERHVVGGREYSIDARLLLCLAKPLGGATVENFLHLGVAQSAAVLDALGHRIDDVDAGALQRAPKCFRRRRLARLVGCQLADDAGDLLRQLIVDGGEVGHETHPVYSRGDRAYLSNDDAIVGDGVIVEL